MPGQPLISPVGRESGDYVRWFIEHAFVLVPAQAVVGQHLMSFRQFSPRQRPVPSRSSRRWRNSGHLPRTT